MASKIARVVARSGSRAKAGGPVRRVGRLLRKFSQYQLTILTGIRLSGDSGNHDAGRTRVCVCASCDLGAFEDSARFPPPRGSSPIRSPSRARRGFVCVCTRSLACARAEQSSDMHHLLSPVPHEIRPPRASFSVLLQSIVGSHAQDPDDLSQVKPEGAGNAPAEAFTFGYWTSVLQCENPAAKPRLTFNKVGIDN